MNIDEIKDVIAAGQSETLYGVAESAFNLKIQETLLESENPTLLTILAYNTNAHPEILEQLGEKQNPDILRAVASNPNTETELLKKLSIHEEQQIRSQVAYNASTDIETLLKLATDPTIPVRSGVAYHSDTPTHILTHLASDTSLEVVINVATNETTPPDTLETLATHYDERIRIQVAYNPNINETTTDILLEDNPKIVKALANNTATNAETLSKIFNKHPNNESIVESVAEHPNTPTELLTKILTLNPSEKTQTNLARNTNTSTDVLTQLSTHPNEHIRHCVAQNPNTNQNTRRALTQDTPVVATSTIWQGTKLTPDEHKELYTLLEKRNLITTSLTVHALTHKTPFSQNKLIELYELGDTHTKTLIQKNYTITHPLLTQLISTNKQAPKNILNPTADAASKQR